MCEKRARARQTEARSGEEFVYARSISRERGRRMRENYSRDSEGVCVCICNDQVMLIQYIAACIYTHTYTPIYM